MLKKLEVNGVVGCLLAPTHAGQIAAALAKTQKRQAIVVLQPDLEAARVMMACGEFADDVSDHRLWFVVGEGWAQMFRAMFEQNPGLPVPSQFIRLPITPDDVALPLIRTAEAIFNDVNASRARQASLASAGNSLHGLLLVTPSHFRLWDDAGHALSASFGDGVARLDVDDPAQASALGLALAAAGCDALLVPDRPRGELPDVLSANVRVISWITQPRIPRFDAAHSNDGLVLADEGWMTLALSAGWPAARLAVGGWPAADVPAGNGLAMICDTGPLDTPTAELDLSSHHVLWELIRADLLADPFALRGNVEGFIERRRQKLGVAAEGLDVGFFVSRLMLPAYQQAIARRLLDAGFPLRLYGKGWDALPRLAAAHRGEIRERNDLIEAARAAALVYAWPVRHRHAMDAFGRPVVGPWTNQTEMMRSIRGTTNKGSAVTPDLRSAIARLV